MSRRSFASPLEIRYDEATYIYTCPGGNTLTTTGVLVNEGATLLYRASKANCSRCALKPGAARTRQFGRCPAACINMPGTSPALSPATPAFEQSRRERKRVEMLFRLGRLRLRGPCSARDEFLLAATAQNLRKLAKLVPVPQPIPDPIREPIPAT